MKKILLSAFVACSMVSAQAALSQYTVNFTSAGEAQASPAIGSGTVTYDSVTHSLQLQAVFSGLQGPTTASHIHAPTAVAGTGGAGVATTTPTFALFPLGVTSGSFSNTLDMTLASSYNPAFVTAHGSSLTQAETDLVASFAAGTAYWNIHSTFGPGGEIRGFLTAVPEPSSLALAGLGVVGLAVRVWKKRCANNA
jgi:CHRD domain/PEP-CTERM motif